jgi:hypothetical protein
MTQTVTQTSLRDARSAAMCRFAAYNMKNLFLIIILTIIYSLCNGQCATNLTYKGDTAFTPTNYDLYTGKYEEYYPGNTKVSGQYISGLKNGKFIYFNSLGEIDSAISYQNGIKEGLNIKYHYHFWVPQHYVMSKEYYSKGQINDTAFYWDETGQLSKLLYYKNGVLISHKEFPIDTSILHISFIILGEKEGMMTDGYIDKKIFRKKSNIKLCVVKWVALTDLGLEGPQKAIVLDTYKVLSFSMGGCINLDKKTNDHIDVGAAFSNSECFTPEMMDRVFKHYTRMFWINNIIIQDCYGIKYELTGRKFIISNYDKR